METLILISPKVKKNILFISTCIFLRKNKYYKNHVRFDHLIKIWS